MLCLVVSHLLSVTNITKKNMKYYVGQKRTQQTKNGCIMSDFRWPAVPQKKFGSKSKLAWPSARYVGQAHAKHTQIASATWASKRRNCSGLCVGQTDAKLKYRLCVDLIDEMTKKIIISDVAWA